MKTFGVCLLAMSMIFCGAVLSDSTGQQSYFFWALVVGGLLGIWALITDDAIVAKEE